MCLYGPSHDSGKQQELPELFPSFDPVGHASTHQSLLDELSLVPDQ